MAEDKESRTEEATDKRLNDARGDGNVPMSREATNFSYLLAALLVIAVLGQTFLIHFSHILTGLQRQECHWRISDRLASQFADVPTQLTKVARRYSRNHSELTDSSAGWRTPRQSPPY